MSILPEKEGVMSKQEFNWRFGNNREAYEWVSCERSPLGFPFLLFTCDPHIGAFQFFKDEAEAVEFLTKFGLGLDDEEQNPEANALMAGKTKLDAVLAHQLEQVYENTTAEELEWWGTFEDLCESDDMFCQDWRERFRTSEDEEVNLTSPIMPEEQKKFIKYITEGHF
jgi:hypothetical protein